MSLPLDALKVVVTGEVPGMDREAARAAVRTLGGVPAAGVTGAVDLLVVGDGAGAAKLRKAGELGLRQLPATAFAALVRDPASWDGSPLGDPAEPPAAAPRTDRPRLAGAHTAGSSSWVRNGVYTTVVHCRCGWRDEASRYNDARTAHSTHRRDVDDPDLALETADAV